MESNLRIPVEPMSQEQTRENTQTLENNVRVEEQEQDQGMSSDGKGTARRLVTQFRYRFYEKPMSSKFCTLETSFSSWEQKKSSLAQEVARRLGTTSTELDTKIRLEIFKQFCNKLTRSGYSNK